MRLADAIMLGSLMAPQTFGILFKDGKACAIGAAMLALGHAPHKTNTITSAMLLDLIFPWTTTAKVRCPDCQIDIAMVVHAKVATGIFPMIIHLNDAHRWTRERIAEWVASVDPTPITTFEDAIAILSEPQSHVKEDRVDEPTHTDALATARA